MTMAPVDQGDGGVCFQTVLAEGGVDDEVGAAIRSMTPMKNMMDVSFSILTDSLTNPGMATGSAWGAMMLKTRRTGESPKMMAASCCPLSTESKQGGVFPK